MKLKTDFDFSIRGVILRVEAIFYADHEGIYDSILDAYAEGANITALLSPDDIAELEAEALKALEAEHEDTLYWEGGH